MATEPGLEVSSSPPSPVPTPGLGAGQDTGFNTSHENGFLDWMRSSRFKSVMDREQYVLRQRVLQGASTRASASFVYKTRHNFNLGEDGALYHLGRGGRGFLRVIPLDEIFRTIEQEHNAIHHQGVNKTWGEVADRYHGIPKRAVAWILKRCSVCHAHHPGPRPIPLRAIVSQDVMERVQMDLIDMRSAPDGDFFWILHIKDHFSKYCMLYPLRSQSGKDVVRCFLEWIAFLGPPCILQTDNGGEFVNRAIETAAEQNQIRIVRGRPNTPRTQGVVERANGHVRKLVAKWCRRFHRSDWAWSLPSIAMACNTAVHATTGKSPFEVVFGRKVNACRASPLVGEASCRGSDPAGVEESRSDPGTILAQARAQSEKARARMLNARQPDSLHPPGSLVTVAIQGVDRSVMDDYRLPGVVLRFETPLGYRVCTQWGILEVPVPSRHVLLAPDASIVPQAAVQLTEDPHAPSLSMQDCVEKLRNSRSG